MFVNNFKMIFRISLATLLSLTIVSALARKEDVTDETSRKVKCLILICWWGITVKLLQPAESILHF